VKILALAGPVVLGGAAAPECAYLDSSSFITWIGWDGEDSGRQTEKGEEGGEFHLNGVGTVPSISTSVYSIAVAKVEKREDMKEGGGLEGGKRMEEKWSGGSRREESRGDDKR
jgi:hypothetical protein